MPLSLIVGPPNSGRAGRIHDALLGSLDDDPVLIVPTGDDVARFERELGDAAGEGTGVLGVSVQTFRLMFEEVARVTGTVLPPALSEPGGPAITARLIPRPLIRTRLPSL